VHAVSLGLRQLVNIYVFDIYFPYRLPGPLESSVDCACGVHDTACTVHLKGGLSKVTSHLKGTSAESIFIVEYLREFEFMCKTVLAHESGDPGVQFNEKTEGRNSRDTVPLSQSKSVNT
jgi:hypothetical protein